MPVFYSRTRRVGTARSGLAYDAAAVPMGAFEGESMPFAAVNGQRIHYADSGGNGPVVVFSHGFFMDQDMWDPQVEELRPAFRCLSISARGFGLTESDRRPFTYWDLADDIIAVMDHAKVDTAILVGLSQGGFTTQRAAIAHSDRVRAIVLCDTDCNVETDETKPLYYGTKDTLLTNGWTNDLAQAMAGMLFAPGYDASFWIERWQTNSPERIGPAFDALIERDNVKERLSEITCPALVIHGELDGTMPIECANELCRRIPGCEQVVVIPGAGHTSNLENRDAFNLALRPFVVKHSS
jgi:pimeloyl-ACP methyl ester carboxylesterase